MALVQQSEHLVLGRVQFPSIQVEALDVLATVDVPGESHGGGVTGIGLQDLHNIVGLQQGFHVAQKQLRGARVVAAVPDPNQFSGRYGLRNGRGRGEAQGVLRPNYEHVGRSLGQTLHREDGLTQPGGNRYPRLALVRTVHFHTVSEEGRSSCLVTRRPDNCQGRGCGIQDLGLPGRRGALTLFRGSVELNVGIGGQLDPEESTPSGLSRPRTGHTSV